MIIDFHTHIFPPFFKEKGPALYSSEPAFEVLYRSPNARLVEAEELLDHMNREGVEKSVVFGFPWKARDHFRRHNDYVIESVQRYPERLVGLCCFHPLSPEAPKEAERCLNAGLSGLGELAFYESGISADKVSALGEIMALCFQHDVPLLFHTNEPVGHDYAGKTPMTLREIYAFLKSYPSNRIVLAHWGGGLFFYALMKKEVKQALGNVWFDTAASPYLYTPRIYKIAEELIGVEKILLGSDYPLLGPQRYVEEMQAAGLSTSSIRKIAGANAASLLKLTG